jgi:hypothetical protein
MSVNPLTSGTGTDPISQLVSKVLAKYDVDKDGSLTATEFGSFLSGLLNGTASIGAAAAQKGNDDGAGKGAYRASLAGFDFAKLDDPSLRGATTSKYKAARIFQDYPPKPESLPAVIERLKAEGINAVQTDIDKVDFGDGYGPIDVIQGAYAGGGVAWQWLPRE